ncbi:MAG TPA: FmdB family transcriptional regulator [Opitutaceae bacterium]|nr:FmdB family transcriptional regulator [Opitutaceae bacterium]
MPIYEYYSPDTNKIYSFYAKTLAQGRTIPRCPDNPKARMRKLVSAFAVSKGRKEEGAGSGAGAGAPAAGPEPAEDARMEAAMGAMEREFAQVDENDPKAMARMMRRMSELTGERFDEPMEEAVRRLEEGADPESLEGDLGGVLGDEEGGPVDAAAGDAPKEPRARRRARRPAVRDPKLYDYE